MPRGAHRHSPDITALPWLLAVFAGGAALRLLSFNERSFWLDETTAVRQATWPIAEMLERMSDNVHPPFFHTLLHGWIDVFGSSEIAVRSFALTWGLLAIPLAYWVGTVVFDRRSAVFAAGIVALAPFFVWYSQEARMYTMLLVFALLSTGALWRALRTDRARWWALYGVSVGLGMMTQYFFVFLLLGHSAHVLFIEIPQMVRDAWEAGIVRSGWGRIRRVFTDAPVLRGWIISLLLASLPLLAWIPRVVRHRDLFRGVSGAFNYGGEPPVLGVHFNSQALVVAEWLFGFHSEGVMRSLVAAWPLLITAAFMLGGLAHGARPSTRFLAVSAAVGVGAISLFGMWQPIVLEVRYYTAATVPVVLLLGHLLAGLRRPVVLVVTAALLALAVTSWVDQSYNPDSVVKWDNRAAMGIVADGYRTGDAVLLIPYFVSSIPQYYLPPDIYAEVQRVPSFDRFGHVRNTPGRLGEDLERQVGFAERVWVISTWTETPRIELDRRTTGSWLAGRGYRVTRDHRLRRIRVTLYEGRPVNDFLIEREGAQ